MHKCFIAVLSLSLACAGAPLSAEAREFPEIDRASFSVSAGGPEARLTIGEFVQCLQKDKPDSTVTRANHPSGTHLIREVKANAAGSLIQLYEFRVSGTSAVLTRIALAMGGQQEVVKNDFHKSLFVIGACDL